MNGLDSERRNSAAGWLVLTAGLAVGIPGFAQDVELEEILVTGSRIARPDFESASPIVSVTQEHFQETGATSVELVMNRLPQLVPDATSTSNNPGRDGQAQLQLRGLGPHRTLVLLDGRRIVPANANGIVDANIIPASLIESVEIITGRASAVYGAVGGGIGGRYAVSGRRDACRFRERCRRRHRRGPIGGRTWHTRAAFLRRSDFR